MSDLCGKPLIKFFKGLVDVKTMRLVDYKTKFIEYDE